MALDVQTAAVMLKNAGFTVRGATQTHIVIQEPGCILGAFESFLDYAWAIILIITAFLLFGWAISIIRGAQTDLTKNIRNLMLMFAALSALKPTISLIYGQDIYVALKNTVCKDIDIPMDEINKVLDSRNSDMSNQLYEHLDIDVTEVPATDNVEIDVSGVERILLPETGNEDVGRPVPISNTEQTYLSTNDGLQQIPNWSGTMPNVSNTEFTPPQWVQDALNSRGSFNLNIGPGAVMARPSGRMAVTYVNPDNTSYTHKNGTVSWRNNNPGNIRKCAGQIGEANRFGIYASEQAGFQAIINLLRGPRYRNKTIAEAMKTYAPFADGNDPVRYAKTLSKRTGISVNKVVGSLTDAEITKLAQEIKRVEGWKPGQVIR